ncbi:M1 family metallopeptidase [Algiphilus sp. W345]|uniref:M1 family metallopeptidase n=1 Tax=Banduia mediterranea TaxID=3075609 RepID=A0ABU2WLM6_9GAMM|nr:M1 family metallopeptidase [Algiphilus sp. W345]MDT0497952.1 M1 family metallopeptidase [Algiphilus sp. W345]
MNKTSCLHTLRIGLVASLGLGGCATVATPGSNPAATGIYDPRETFAPLSLPQAANRYRSGNGAPGPDYWQNRVDYSIHADLDTESQQLGAREVIHYTNNSPDALASLWLQLDQNIYRKDARSIHASGWPRTKFTEGYRFAKVEVEVGGQRYPADYLIDDTRMQVRLRQPLPPGGADLKLHIDYDYDIPGDFGGRTAIGDSEHGPIYDIAQWYPRMAVYDDQRGWDTLPYLASEFYLEYGDFDYWITVPAAMLVAGSGELVNPQDVLTAQQRQRLKQARSSDRTVMIRSPEEVGDPASRPQSEKPLTWHYHMQDTRDTAFAASAAFVWDAARIQLPGGRTSLAMSYYPAERAGDDAWGRSTEFLKHAVEQFSQRWFPYPYPAAINVGGPVGGMEYPGILFDSMKDGGGKLFWITVHEIGHTWFPMIVGFDERRSAWMDEGFNTFIDVYESDDFNDGEFGPKRDSEYTPGGGSPVEEIIPIMSDPEAPIPLIRADAIAEKYRHSISYYKSALGLILLREQILGPERFDWAFRKFIADWAFKHPSPSDFFRAMDSAGGEDLSWFWRGWYLNNWTLDLATTGVHAVDGDDAKGYTVTIANLDRLVMPATVQIDFADGTQQRERLPAEAWLQKTEVGIHVDRPVARVSVDPDHLIPDRNRDNNVYEAPTP